MELLASASCFLKTTLSARTGFMERLRIDEKAGEEIDDTGHLRLTMQPLRRCAPTARPDDRGTGGQMAVECLAR